MESWCFIIMPKFERGTLLRTLMMANKKKAKLSNESQQFLARQALLPLRQLHRSGIAHCDVKPDNYVHLDDLSLRLIDYGSADDLTARISRWISTVNYAPPEVL